MAFLFEPHPLAKVITGAIGSLFSSDSPRQTMPVGAIGWTQDSVNSHIFNITSNEAVPIMNVVNQALSDPRGAAAYLREAYPDPIRVFDSGRDGILSIDNRRLVAFRMALPADAQIPVIVMTQEQAGQALAGERRVNPRTALRRRYTTRDGGYSILIRHDDTTVSQGECYVSSPYVLATDE